MTFIFNFFFFWVSFPLPRKHFTNSQSQSRETDACGGCRFLAPPTHNNGDHLCVEPTYKMGGPTSETECEETDIDEEIVPKRGHITSTWSLTKDRPAFGVKCVDEYQPLQHLNRPKQNSESISLQYHASVSLPQVVNRPAPLLLL